MRIDDIFAMVAKQHGISREEVYVEIQKAIDAGFDNLDPLVRAEWKKISIRGKRPMPEEVLAYMVEQLQNKRGH